MSLVDTYEADWQTRLRGRLYEQFKEDANLLAVVDAFAAQVQELEDAGAALIYLFAIDPITEGTGSHLYWVGRAAQLERIGVLVGQDRGGVDDPTYRLYLRARLRANRSSGTAAELYAVFFAMLGASASLQITPSYPAGLSLTIASPALNGAAAAVALDFLGDAKMAPVLATLLWQPAVDADMFTVDDAGAVESVTGLGCGDATDYSVGGVLAGALTA